MHKMADPLVSKASLADQIKDAACKYIVIKPIEQGRMRYCQGAEDVIIKFLDVLSQYPPSIFRLPISTILIEITDETEPPKRISKKKMRRILSKLSTVISSALGQGDTVVRYHNNRFAILLMNVNETMAGKICQRIKEGLHRYCYFSREPLALAFEFATSQHDCLAGNDFAELVFSNEQTIKLARALGAGAIVSRQDKKENFRYHPCLSFNLGELHRADLFSNESEQQ